MKITIHQPEHMPWLGLFHKINMADVYVVLDNVQFRKNYFLNRNKIKTANGWTWINVPVNHNIETLIKDVQIASDSRWKKKWWDTIFYSYKKASNFNNYSDELENLVNENWTNLSQLNISLLKFFCNHLEIKTDFILASELDIDGKASDLILNICKKMGAESYVSGISGRDYLKLDDFKNNNITVTFQEFHHPVYKQLYAEPFVPCMSVADLLFNYGNDGLAIINGEGVPVMEEVFQ